ncbi:MAG: multicopper oxidase domain-containing protein [Acidobacteriia bacterium]|nr:multicopper oxidase domain-containing protein [Terriglobia bacterium]
MLRTVVIELLCVAMLGPLALAAEQTASSGTGKVHTYYVAADEVEWDYAPDGINKMMGMKFDGYAATFMQRGKHSIGKVYRKAIYREYTDGSFTQLKPRAPEWEHLGILGPVLRAEVGDTIRVVFKNNATRPYSMHPHGVFYEKGSEGSVYDDGSSAADKANSVVPPGETHTYNWQVSERAGPGPADGSSVVWLYHSHVNEQRDVNSGLIGPIIITAKGMAGPDGRPKDVDREFINLFLIFDENVSWYLDHNIQTYTTDPKGVKKLDGKPVDADGLFSIFGTGFTSENFRSSINGYMYGNGPMMTMKKGERVRWYLISLGGIINGHTPHWHGNVVLAKGHRTDVLTLAQAEMLTADMVPDNPGIWMYHCHVDDHMTTGMVTLYKVEP